MKKNIKTIIFYVVIIALFALAALYLTGKGREEALTYDKVLAMFDNNEVTEFSIKDGNILSVVMTDGKKNDFILFDPDRFLSDIEEYLDEQRALPEDQRTLKSWDLKGVHTSAFVAYLPYIIMLLASVGLCLFLLKKFSSTAEREDKRVSMFSRAKVKYGANTKEKTYFSDVAGADEEKEQLREVVDYLRDPDKYKKLGARIPRGVLLVGPPGTGKTLLARAVAGEADVPFLSISGSDFVELYVGVGASRVRDLFATARKSPASIIFIDEIDAVGRHRGAGLGGGHDEREQTLNQLLVEMDGFEAHDGVVVMAATNRPDILDPALLRPGRFDHTVTVNYPDLQGRIDILKVHARNKPFENAVDFKRIAQTTVGFTGADLANLLNESALIAARKNKHLIGEPDVDEAMIKVTVGTQKKSRKIKESEKRHTAYHEAGHAILAHILPTQDPVRQISIIPSGMALGYTLTPPVEDKYSEYKKELGEEITMLLGGRAAEEIVYGDISGGASSDISKATQTARKMVTVYGMSELGTIRFGSEHSSDEVFLGRDFNNDKNYSEETAAQIDRQIKKIIDSAYADALRILRENRDKLDFITEFLVKNETMDDAQFNAAMDGASIEELDKMAEERRKKSDIENELRAKAYEEDRKQDEENRKRREEAKKSKDVNYKDFPGNDGTGGLE